MRSCSMPAKADGSAYSAPTSDPWCSTRSIRGQWVEGPFGPIGAFRAAPRLRVPALYITVWSDRYVSPDEVRRLYRLTASQDKDLVVIPSGSGGFDAIDFSSYEGRVRTAILSFVRHVAGARSS
jgi:hypothetical protein